MKQKLPEIREYLYNNHCTHCGGLLALSDVNDNPVCCYCFKPEGYCICESKQDRKARVGAEHAEKVKKYAEGMKAMTHANITLPIKKPSTMEPLTFASYTAEFNKMFIKNNWQSAPIPPAPDPLSLPGYSVTETIIAKMYDGVPSLEQWLNDAHLSTDVPNKSSG